MDIKKEHLIHLSTIHRQQYMERRGWEWKVFLTEVSLLILTVVFALEQQQKLSGKAWSVSLFAASTGVLAILYLSWIHAAGNSDKNFAEEAEDCLNFSDTELNAYCGKNESIYAAAKSKNRNPARWTSQFTHGFKHTWSFKFQAGIIAISAVFVVIATHMILHD